VDDLARRLPHHERNAGGWRRFQRGIAYDRGVHFAGQAQQVGANGVEAMVPGSGLAGEDGQLRARVAHDLREVPPLFLAEPALE
jgi:hypothetical protein